MSYIKELPLSPIIDVEDEDNEDNEDNNYLEEYKLIKYVIDFMDNEKKYYNLIKSYSYGNKINLFIQEKNIVIAAGYLEEDSSVIEYMKNGVVAENTYESVWKWVNDNKERVVTGKELADSIFIGSNYVSFWKIMTDAYEEELNNKEADDNEPTVEIKDDNYEIIEDDYKTMKNDLFFWLFYSFVIIIVSTYILMRY